MARLERLAQHFQTSTMEFWQLVIAEIRINPPPTGGKIEAGEVQSGGNVTTRQLPAREAIAVGRFSTDEQAEGDSIRRQQNSFVRVCQRWELQPSNRWTIFDKGLSGFKGEHLSEKAELGRFLRALEAGQVRPDAYGRMPVLVWEAVDRMTRLPQLLATDLVKQFVDAGIAIVFDEADLWIDSSTIADKWIILQVLIDQAYQYSRRLSRRLKSSWQSKREKAVSSGERFGKRRPCWVGWDPETGRFVLNSGAGAVQFIFQKTIDGWGQRQIVGELQKRFPPIGSSGRWNTSFVQKVLSERSVLGERHPHQFNPDGERVPVGKPILNYYPAVVDEAMWYRAQAAKERRKRQKGPNTEFINLFTGLVFNAHDGYRMHAQTTRREGYVQRRLVSYGHLSKVQGTDPVTVPYHEFERIVLRNLSELDMADLQPRDSTTTLAAKQEELSGIEQRLGELGVALADPQVRNSPTIMASVLSLEKKRTAVLEQIERLQAETHAGHPICQAQDVLHLLQAASPAQKRTLRMKLRSLISALIDSIYLKPEKHYGRVYFVAQLFFRAGLVKQVMAGPGMEIGCKEQTTACEFTVDLRRREQANSVSLCAQVAKMLMELPEPETSAEVADTVGAAADAWLRVARRSMAKKSFRVVPSKIKRFVTFVGGDLPTADINRAKWQKWGRWLRRQVATAQLARSTARVTYSRAREFVRWLIANERTAQFTGLEVSGNNAVS
jgi:DNA invertase Pin-like site-specific DNA recombinase